MQYEQSRQRKDGKWAWTSMWNGEVSTSGGCLVIQGDTRTVDEMLSGVPMPDGATVTHHAHDTSEEADRCHWERDRSRLYILENDPRIGKTIQLCEMDDCFEYATRLSGVPGDMVSWYSCEAHAGTTIYDQRNPFTKGLQIIHS